MSTFLNVLEWTAIACGVGATIMALIRLTLGDAAPGKAKPGARGSAWRFLCYSVGALLLPASRLVDGTAAWAPLGLALGLVVFAFIWDVRLASRA